MNVLAFDTCFGACSAAVRLQATEESAAADSFTLAGRYEGMATGHAERLMPMIGEVMQAARCTFADLDAIAVTEGPGTFTGLRIGVAAARAFSLAAGLPIRATSSLHLMAYRAMREIGSLRPREVLAAFVDARDNQSYVHVFSACPPTPYAPLFP